MTALHDIVIQSHDLAPLTRTKYLRDLDTWVAFAGKDPHDWTRATAQRFYNSLLQRMKPQSANRLFASVRYASSWWAKRENNPALDFAVIQQATRQRNRAVRRALEPEEAQRLIATCNGSTPIDLRDRALIVVGLETGMRRMSLGAMQIEQLKMAREGYPVALVPIKGSAGELYPVPLSDAAIAAITPWRDWLRSKRITKGPLFRTLPRKVDGRGKLTVDVGPGGLSSSAIYKMIATRADAAGIGHMHPHIFRHTFITWRMQAGLQPYQVATITGHKLAGLPGMGALGGYIDASRIANEARQSTPTWLNRLITRRP